MTVFTIGYEGRVLDEFIADLQAHGVQLLADVREAPISRKRGFAKSALSLALREAGIDYTHIRALGCPRPIRDQHREDHDWERYTRAYLQHLDDQRPAVDELAALTQAQPTALMCFEADFNRCHRTYVARAIAARTADPVQHITAAGVVSDGTYSMSERPQVR
jgi:uncharacterized protein (DUF488 family)